MRFFHLSDLHLGIKLYEHDLLKDQKAILDEIVALTRQYQPDAVVFAGDIYDRSVPPVEAVALFDDFMTQLRAALPNGAVRTEHPRRHHFRQPRQRTAARCLPQRTV